MHTRTRWVRRAIAAALALSLVAAACGDDGDSSEPGGNESTTTAANSSSSTTEAPDAPESGGIATIGEFSSAPGLDPAKMAGGGTVGGMIHAALYDTIVQYDFETGEYIPRTGEFTANDDFTVWTLKLKDGITFADGTPYNAEAVKFVAARELTEGNPAPRGQLASFLGTDPETAMTVVDDLTLQFNLTVKPWTDFPYLFANVSGWIYSPTQFQKVGAEAFNTNPGPAGAGPFLLKSYKPGESVELERNPNYWGGEVYLDGLVFRLLNGPQATYEAIKAGTLQGGFVRDPEVVASAEEEGYGLVLMPAVAGNIANMNSGAPITCKDGKPEATCAGKADGNYPSTAATANPKVRQAVAAAVDPEVINARVYNGKAQPDSGVFANSPWDPEVPGPEADLDKAKELVAEAKQEGWDGKIRVLSGTDPVGLAWGEAVRTQLVAAGMDAELTNKPTAEIVNQVIVLKDYDVATWAYGMLDEFPANYVQLASTFQAPAGRYGYSSPEMLEALDMMRTAMTQEERVAANKAVAEIWVRDMPAHVITAIPQALVMAKNFHGAERTAGSNILFDKAWLEQ